MGAVSSYLVERMLGGVDIWRLAGQRRVLLDFVLLLFELAIGVFGGLSLHAPPGFRRGLNFFRFLFRLLWIVIGIRIGTIRFKTRNIRQTSKTLSASSLSTKTVLSLILSIPIHVSVNRYSRSHDVIPAAFQNNENKIWRLCLCL